VVTGYKTSEYEMFGITPIAHDLRYEMADEFSVLLRRLWTEDENLTVKGRWWPMKDAFVAPKPVNGTVIMVNAASSGAGLDYAAKHSDLSSSQVRPVPILTAPARRSLRITPRSRRSHGAMGAR
jgi:FMNH2-dependent dimethyl sulfone monooxygenase